MPSENTPPSASVDSIVRRPCRHTANVNASIHGDKINCFCNDCQIGWHGVMRPITLLSGKVRKPPRWVQVHIDKVSRGLPQVHGANEEYTASD